MTEFIIRCVQPLNLFKGDWFISLYKVRKQRVSFHIIAFYDRVQYADPHPASEFKNFQKRVENGDQFIISKKLFETSIFISIQSILSLSFKMQISLKMILTNFAINFAVVRFFFVDIFLGQIYIRAEMKIYSKFSSEDL